VTRGLRIQAGVTDADLSALAALRTRCNEADGTEDVYTVDVLANEMAHPSGWDPTTDDLLADLDGTLVGWGRANMHLARSGEQVLEAIVRVDPAYRGRGIGRALLHRCEARLRERAAAEPHEGRRILATYATDPAAGAGSLFESEGYRPVRYYFHMVRPDLEGLAAPELPDAFEIRAVHEEDLETILDASDEAFGDEWLEAQPTTEDRARYLGDPRVDPSLWLVAWHGDQVASLVFAADDADANARYGRRRVLLDAVATRRPYRRRGLASALMLRALHAARDAGFTSADLWVDSENPSGALRVYERIGFEVVLRSTAYHKDLSG
jgi:mycothiol synthase